MNRHPKQGARGVSLVEAMVALAVMAFGMLTVVGVQSTLRLNADVAKQRTEATLIGQEQMEKDRSFTQIEAAVGVASWSTIVSDVAPREVTGLNAVYQVRRQVTYDVPPAKVLSVTVSWNDRSGQNQSVTLNTSIAAAAPALSGTLAVNAGTSPVAPVRRPFRRHQSIPAQARDFGSSSAFVPPGYRSWFVILFDNLSGQVTGLCELAFSASNETITLSDVQSCSNVNVGQLVSGFVRFRREVDGSELTAADVEDPIGPALNLRIQIDLTSSGHPQNPECFDDMTGTLASNGGRRFATYFCVVFSNSSLQWSGISTIEALNSDNDSWQITNNTSESNAYRVCRYTPAANDSASVPNQDHPRNYTSVSGNLTNQNFVVIRSVKHCPTDGPANPTSGDFINTNTLQHQPTP